MRFAIVIVFTLALLLAGCKKEEDPNNIFLEVLVVHHDIPVLDAQVYLKNNVTEYPGDDTSVYDETKDVDGQGQASFNKLAPGNYFLYSEGFDGVDSVFGYMPVTLTDSMLFETVNRTLYISE